MSTKTSARDRALHYRQSLIPARSRNRCHVPYTHPAVLIIVEYLRWDGLAVAGQVAHLLLGFVRGGYVNVLHLYLLPRQNHFDSLLLLLHLQRGKEIEAPAEARDIQFGALTSRLPATVLMYTFTPILFLHPNV